MRLLTKPFYNEWRENLGLVELDGDSSIILQRFLFLQILGCRALFQVADHIAYAVFRRYNTADTKYFDIISSRFDSSTGIIHGLAHLQKVDPLCMCPGCLSRRTPQIRLHEGQATLDLGEDNH